MARDQYVSPQYKRAVKSRTISHASFVAHLPTGKTIVQGDRIGSVYAMLRAAAYQAAGRKVEVVYGPQDKRRRVEPFLGPYEAHQWLLEALDDHLMRNTARQRLAWVQRTIEEEN